MIDRLKGRATQIVRRATDETIRAHVVGSLFILGAILSAITMVFSHPDEGEAVIWGVVVVASIIGTALLWRSARLPDVLFHAAVASGSFLINVLMLASGVAAGVYAGMFNWVVLVIVNFFSPRAAIAHFAWMMGCFAVVLTLVESGGEYSALTRWIVAVFALSVTGCATGWLVFRRRVAEQSAQRFLDLSQEMLCTIDIDGCFARLNAAWSRTFGYSEGELLSKPLSSLIHPGDRAIADLAFSRVRNTGGSELFENRCRDSEGHWHALRWTVSYSVEEELIYARARPLRAERPLIAADSPVPEAAPT